MTVRKPACGGVYHSARVAAGYAFARPPVHDGIVQLIAARLGVTADRRRQRALDVGCGAGRSTAPLAQLAGTIVGVEPAPAMLEHHAAVAPAAWFVVGDAEALPFAGRTFDVITCAGALNYTDVDRALAEIARVLARAGALAVYDFSAGRRCRGAADLEGWFEAFERRYPFPAGYALDVAALDYGRAGLRLASYEPFDVALPMTRDAYLAYVLSETNVQRAVTDGVPDADIRDWCRATLEPLFDRGALDVCFEGYLAYIVHQRARLSPERRR